MKAICNYAILRVRPDARRGESVNIGLVLFRENSIDVRVCETRKLTALTARSWDAAIDEFSALLRDTDDLDLDVASRMKRLSIIQNQFVLDRTGWFLAQTEEEYETRVRDALRSLVERPKRKRASDFHSVSSEIATVLRSANILATNDDNLESGKVFRHFTIEDGLVADFVQRNSRLHVASVLDLRANSPQLAQAALKAVVLDRAEVVYGEQDVHKIGVFAAAPARLNELHANLAILRPYAHELVNWEDRQDREGLTRLFYDGYNAHRPTAI